MTLSSEPYVFKHLLACRRRSRRRPKPRTPDKTRCLQVAWKKWALGPANVQMVVAVAWWVLAHVFQPGSHGSPALQASVLQAFSKCYAHAVLRSRKDSYIALWLVGAPLCEAPSAVALRHAAAGCVPGSSPVSLSGPAMALLRCLAPQWDMCCDHRCMGGPGLLLPGHLQQLAPARPHVAKGRCASARRCTERELGPGRLGVRDLKPEALLDAHTHTHTAQCTDTDVHCATAHAVPWVQAHIAVARAVPRCGEMPSRLAVHPEPWIGATSAAAALLCLPRVMLAGERGTCSGMARKPAALCLTSAQRTVCWLLAGCHRRCGCAPPS